MFVAPASRVSLQPSGILQRVVGEMQNFICSITINSTIDPNSVELTWTYDDSNITTDDRVTIIPTIITGNQSSFTYTAAIQFTYLMEGDEGNYTCNVISDNITESGSVILQSLISMFTYISF